MKSIRGRLMVTLLTGLILVLVAGGGAVHRIVETGLTEAFDSRLEEKARTLASLVTLEGWSLQFDGDDGPAHLVHDTRYELRTASGEFLKRSDALAESLAHRAPAEGTIAFDDVTLEQGLAGRAAWYAFRPLVERDDDDEDEEDEDDEALGAPAPPDVAPEVIVAMVALERGSIDAALATVRTALLVVGVLLTATVVLLVGTGVRWGLRPLDRLATALEEVDTDRPHDRFAAGDAPPELEPVYRELNHMLDRVEATLERERAFAHAAAHELRTPLAELRTTAEVALRWPDTERAEVSLRELLAIGSEMESLVEALLMIGRGEKVGVAGASTSIRAVVDRCLDREATPIRDKQLAVDVDIDADDTLPAPREAVEIIVRNIVDNAVHYTPDEGAIVIRGNGVEQGHPELIVENGPVTLVDADMPRLFEPFWRLEHARSDREHSGLGLAVVQQVAKVMGLRVEAHLVENRLRMRVTS